MAPLTCFERLQYTPPIHMNRLTKHYKITLCFHAGMERLSCKCRTLVLWAKPLGHISFCMVTSPREDHNLKLCEVLFSLNE